MILLGGINKSLGILKVSINGTGDYTIDNIYNSIVSAGFGAYCSYDGYYFILKGWIIGEGTSFGNLFIERKSLVFLKGGVANQNPNFTMRFGRYLSDIQGAYNGYGCSIDIQNCRYPFGSIYSTNFYVYGCQLSSVKSLKSTYTEPKYTLYYNGGAQCNLAYNVSNFKENIIEFAARGVTSDILDTKWWQDNNFGNTNHIRLKIWQIVNLPYFGGGKFYDCTWASASRLNHYVFNTTTEYYSDFYDCMFPSFVGNIALCSYTNLNTFKTSLSYINFNYTLSFKIITQIGVAIPGATISVRDKDGNLINWVEYANTINRLVTGNTFNTNRTTDVNGVISYYVNAYKTNLNPLNVTGPTSTDIIYTYKYPFTITVSKTGYETQTIILETLLKKTDLIITLTPSRSYRSTIDGNLLLVTNPEQGSSSNLLEI